MDKVTSMVEQAIRAAVPPEEMVERRTRPESDYSWSEPAPAAGLRAALTVAEMATQHAYKYVLGLRGEGTTWREVADLLNIPWADGHRRAEQAYERVLGPDPEGVSPFRDRYLYWHCRGPLGCGKYITDRGPYNGAPEDNEDGHAGGCRRLASETEAYHLESEREEPRYRISEKATAAVTDRFGRETASRARWVVSHGGRYQGGWSTGEGLAVALVLHDDARLKVYGYSTRAAAVDRICQGVSNPPADPDLWLATIRAAAVGEIDRDDLRATLGI
jgi:hypothetical protein